MVLKLIDKFQSSSRSFARGTLNFLEQFIYKPYYNYPFGKAPKADKGKYTELWQRAKAKKYSVVDSFEKEIGYYICKEWFEELALLTQVVIKKSELCYQHGRLLYSVLSSMITNQSDKCINIIETGTARGFSALCMAKALYDRGQSGKIITFDVLPHDVKMYWNCIADKNGPMTRSKLLETYGDLIQEHVIFHQGDTMRELKKIHLPRVHFAFLDSKHTFDAVMHEFSYLKDKQHEGDIVFFDDYTPSLFPGVVSAVNKVCEKHNYKKRVIRIDDERGYVIATKQ